MRLTTDPPSDTEVKMDGAKSLLPLGNVKVKVKFTLEQATKAQRGSRDKLYSIFNLGAGWGGWSTPRPGRFTPGTEINLTTVLYKVKEYNMTFC